MLVYIVTVSINIYEFYSFYMNFIVVAINMKHKVSIRCNADQVIERFTEQKFLYTSRK